MPGSIRQGRLQLGALSLPAPQGHGADAQVRCYLRPEDLLARPIAEGDAYAFDSNIAQVDFLGAFCHVHVSAPTLSAQPLTVYLSLNFLAEQRLSVGSSLRLKLMPERLKVF